tara:strand:+ start:177 stop:1085 length:909 start_codon:yes stop_codon:yes gene_type:complete
MEKMNNKENNILLSIVIPFHNRVNLLKKTINSIKPFLNSKYEIVLVDDGSKDNAYLELSDYITDNILYFKIKNAERGYARNYGAFKANGTYLNFFDSDDLALKNHLSSFEAYIKKNQHQNIFCNSYFVKNNYKNTKKKVLLNGILNKRIFNHNILSCNSVFIKKEFFNKYKFCEDKNLSGSEDWDLWLRISCDEIILGNPYFSSELIEHDLRSTRNQDVEKMLLRINTLHNRIITKQNINLKSNFKIVLSEIYSFKSLILSKVLKKKLISLSYLIYSIYLRPSRIYEKRTIVILTKIIFSII